MHVDPGDPADQFVRQPRRGASQPEAVLPLAPPTDDQVEVLVDQLGDEPGDVFGIVLQIAVDGHDHLTAGAVQTGLHGRGLTEVALQGDDLHVVAVTLPWTACLVEGVIRTAVVDEDQFPPEGPLARASCVCSARRATFVLFVVQRHDDKTSGEGRGCCVRSTVVPGWSVEIARSLAHAPGGRYGLSGGSRPWPRAPAASRARAAATTEATSRNRWRFTAACTAVSKGTPSGRNTASTPAS